MWFVGVRAIPARTAQSKIAPFHSPFPSRAMPRNPSLISVTLEQLIPEPPAEGTSTRLLFNGELTHGRQLLCILTHRCVPFAALLELVAQEPETADEVCALLTRWINLEEGTLSRATLDPEDSKAITWHQSRVSRAMSALSPLRSLAGSTAPALALPTR